MLVACRIRLATMRMTRNAANACVEALVPWLGGPRSRGLIEVTPQGCGSRGGARPPANKKEGKRRVGTEGVFALRAPSRHGNARNLGSPAAVTGLVSTAFAKLWRFRRAPVALSVKRRENGPRSLRILKPKLKSDPRDFAHCAVLIDEARRVRLLKQVLTVRAAAFHVSGAIGGNGRRRRVGTVG